ncbi:hypothetical protein [Streptomyces sp. NPDC058861]|uniref:hypothetical protein n=1 Tax=Streptomyces sp. NPDC058861 TaxID=3346653 RepID=UPI0036B1423E
MNDEYSRFEVDGQENGGVDLVCLDCGKWVAGGGCNCCVGQEVRLSQLVDAADAHNCTPRKGSANG